MSLTYKKNVADSRKTLVQEMIKELEQFGVDIFGCDPLLSSLAGEFGMKALSSLENVSGIDCIILAVARNTFRETTLGKFKGIMSTIPILIGVQGVFEPAEVRGKGISLPKLAKQGNMVLI